MRYIYFTGGNDYCGCDIDEKEAFPDDVTDDELDEIAKDKAIDNGDAFSYCATGWNEDFEDEEEEEDYYEGCWCEWEEISKEEYEENT